MNRFTNKIIPGTRLLIFSICFISGNFYLNAQIEPPFLSYTAFRAGEELKYIIYYGPINGGIATMKLQHRYFGDKLVLHSKMIAQSIGVTDRLYKVRDIYEAYFEGETALPLKSIRDINEGKYKKFNEVLYHHDSNMVTSKLSGEHSVPPGIRDMVSTFFYLRKIDYSHLKVGDIIEVRTFFDDEVFPFDMRFRGYETVKTKLGNFNCIKLVPFVEPGRIFKTEDDMTIWISNDRNLVPIRVRFDLLVGSLKIDLIEYSGLAN